MGRRLLKTTFKLGVIVAVIGALVVVGKKLMGGLGPEPGSELAPKEWPSLVPDPPAAPAGTNGNGAKPASSNGDSAGDTESAEVE